jgi:hypothetical protein
MKTFAIAVLASLAWMVSPIALYAQAKGDKTTPATQMVKQFMKQLEKAELSSEQSSKISDLYIKVAKEVSAKRTDAGITAEVLKKRTEATKSARDAGKKGKEIQSAGEAAMNLSEAQKIVMTETEAALSKVRIEVGKMLKPEQLAKLSEQFQANLKEKTGNKKNKANK